MNTAAITSAALLTGTTVGLLVRPPGRGVRRLVSARQARRPPDPSVTAAFGRKCAPRLVLAVGVAVLVVLLGGTVFGGQVVMTSGAAAVITGVVIALRAANRRRAEAAVRRAGVIEACGVLAADLRAGRTTRDALDGAASVCSELRPAAAAARLGGDVGAALELASVTPGAGGLRALGTAWRVSERSGAAFAAIAERLAASLRADESVRRQVSAGLAGSRATARLLAALPLLGTLLGYGIGADPLAFLSGSLIGGICLTAGLTLGVLGLVWVEHLATTCEADR